MAFCALGTAVYGASAVLYIPMSQRFGTGADGYSYLLAAAAASGVLGAVLAGKLGASVPLPPVIGAAMALSFAVAGLLRWAGLPGALLIVGLGFSAVAVAGLWPLTRPRVVPAVPAVLAARVPLPA